MAIKSYKKGTKTKLSKNFSVHEFDCKGKGCCTETLIDEQLITYLQKIRDHFEKPVTISSAYRCAKHNAKVANAATRSKHMLGMATDIYINGVAPAEIAKYAESIGILGIGLYETAKDGYFVHVDTRTSKYFWYGQKQISKTTFGGSTKATASNATAGYTLAQFIREVQKATGSKIDGIAGAETISKTVTVSATKNRVHPVVKAIQKRLYALGYTAVGTADGVAGAKFKQALEAFQRDSGCVVDGEATAGGKTWKKLLGMC